jgi:ubiquitin-conjugating enzyme E2 Z
MSVIKRLLTELREFHSEETNNYYLHYSESDIKNIDVLMKCPDDSVYSNTFLRFKIIVPDSYPFTNPKVSFVYYGNSKRIHPNLYENGKICLSILGTWQGPSWSACMNIKSLLMSISSILDNDPYKHEPGNLGDESYTNYVRYSTFELMLDYLKHESIESFKNVIKNHIIENNEKLTEMLIGLAEKNPKISICKKYNIQNYNSDYNSILEKVITIKEKENETEKEKEKEKGKEKEEFHEEKCIICLEDIKKTDLANMTCKHPIHKSCLFTYIKFQNEPKCPFCSLSIGNETINDLYSGIVKDCEKGIFFLSTNSVDEVINSVINNNANTYNIDKTVEKVMNPLTRRMIQVDGKLYKKLVKDGVILNPKP